MVEFKQHLKKMKDISIKKLYKKKNQKNIFYIEKFKQNLLWNMLQRKPKGCVCMCGIGGVGQIQEDVENGVDLVHPAIHKSGIGPLAVS